MNMYGADVAELRRLSVAFTQAADDLDAEGGLMTRLLNNVSWLGDNASRFLNRWTGIQLPQIGLSTQFLRGAAEQLARNADEQERASGASGGSGGGPGLLGRLPLQGSGPRLQGGGPPLQGGGPPIQGPGAITPPEGGLRVDDGSTPRSESPPATEASPETEPYTPGPQPISNSSIADLAEQEIRADSTKYQGRLGWNQPGECMVAMSRWLRAAGGSWPGSPNGPLSGFEGAGAASIPLDELARGDVLQRASTTDPTSWAHVHTMVVLGVDESNPHLVTVAESNYDSNGTMRIGTYDLRETRWEGWGWTGWRMGDRP